MALLLVVGWSVALVVIGLILRAGQGAEILTWGFIAFLLPLSGIWHALSVNRANGYIPGDVRLAIAIFTARFRVAQRGATVVTGFPNCVA